MNLGILSPPTPPPFSGLFYIKNLQWGTADAEIETDLLTLQSSKVLHFKPGAGPYIALHATPTARDFSLC